MAIFSSNLDEFFRVRVAYIRRLCKVKPVIIQKKFSYSPTEIAHKIHQIVRVQHREYRNLFTYELVPAMKENNIILYRRKQDIDEEHLAEIRYYFRTKVLAYLQPVFVYDYQDAPFLVNKALYFAVRMREKGYPDSEVVHAILNIPSQDLPRFYELTPRNGKYYYIFLDEVIRINLETIFPSYDIIDSYSIKITRDAELRLDDNINSALIRKIKKELTKRSVGVPTRFLYDNKMPKDFLEFLMYVYQLSSEDLVPGGRFHNFSDFMKFPNPLSPKFENEAMPALPHLELDSFNSFFDAIDQKDYLLHFPYQSYDYVLRFFNEAAIDPYVREIKVTVYRIAANSFIANALISAARNGKKVTVLVEYKARFDEENNLKWAELMENAGVKIIYSVPGLKVHAKIALVTRKNKQHQVKRYAYLGTGNFNEITARIYTDHGLFTCNPDYVNELEAVFRYLDRQRDKPLLKNLLVSQFNMKERFIGMIDREIENSKNGLPAHIFIKANNIEDETMIDKLYEASQAGVKVDMIVRSICSIRPGIRGLSDNITIMRIVDRYLEHTRIFVFHNNGKPEYYLSSSDWMYRNLNSRIEVGFPVVARSHIDELNNYIQMQWNDDVKACFIDANMNNIRKENKNHLRAQPAIYAWIVERHRKMRENLKLKGTLTID
jgi:polyphosphate kinase